MRSSVQSLSSQLAIQRSFSSFLRSCPWQQNDDEDSSTDGKLPSDLKSSWFRWVLKLWWWFRGRSRSDCVDSDSRVCCAPNACRVPASFVLTVTPGPAVLPLPAEFQHCSCSPWPQCMLYFHCLQSFQHHSCWQWPHGLLCSHCLQSSQHCSCWQWPQCQCSLCFNLD